MSFKALFSAIDEAECQNETIPFSDLTEYERLGVKLFVDGEDRWVDRDSEYLVGWGSFEEQCKPETDVDLGESCWIDPLQIELTQGPGPDDGTYHHTIRIDTDCHLWWPKTETGRVNGNRFLDFIGGLARLDGITETWMYTNRGGTRDLMERLDHESESG